MRSGEGALADGNQHTLPLVREGLRISPIPSLPLFAVNKSRTAPSVVAGIDAALGFPAPRNPNGCSWSPKGEAFCFWASPNSWLVRGEATDAAMGERLSSGLRDVTAGIAAMDGLRGWKVSGVHAARLLSRGCHIDFRDSAFPAGSGVRTHFVFDAVFIVRNTDGYCLYFDGSFYSAMEEWLAQASD